MSYQSKPAAPATVTANRDAVALYDMASRHDFADVERGYLAPLPDQVVNAHGQVVFDARRFDFIGQQDAAPDAVNPSLWRQAQLITKAGPGTSVSSADSSSCSYTRQTPRRPRKCISGFRSSRRS